MTFLGHIRRRPRLIRSVFAAFVLAWLQTAVLPCAMANMDIGRDVQGEIGQPASATMPTDDMAVAMADMPDCVYCPPEQRQNSDADSSVHHCLYPQESRVDSGKAQQVRLDQLVAHPIFISSSISNFWVEPHEAFLPRYLIPPLSERSLNLTHCKQLK